MAESREPEVEQSAYFRLPWPAVAAALFALIALALAIGLYTNQNLRSGIQTMTVTPGSTTVTASAAAAPSPTPTSAPISESTPQPLVAPSPAVAPSVSIAPAAPPRTPAPGVSPALAAEVGDAYKAYWDVRAEAFFNLDTSRLSEVMDGEHLVAVEERIAELRSLGQAIQTDVNHSYSVIEVSDLSARVADNYVDQSIYIDEQTHAPITSPTGQTLKELYTMTKANGSWRVNSLVRSP